MSWKCPKSPNLSIMVFQYDDYDVIELHSISKCGGKCEFDVKSAKSHFIEMPKLDVIHANI